MYFDVGHSVVQHLNVSLDDRDLLRKTVVLADFPGQLLQLGGVARCRHCRPQLQQLERARRLRLQRLAFVALGLLDPGVELGQPAFVGLGGNELAVAVDVGAGQPLRGVQLGTELAHLGVDAGDELVGGFAGRRGGGSRGGRRGDHGRPVRGDGALCQHGGGRVSAVGFREHLRCNFFALQK